tara:strand:- start:214 stop:417 length:204 start_codon:yes stop_codon:yes gene_type:complete
MDADFEIDLLIGLVLFPGRRRQSFEKAQSIANTKVSLTNQLISRPRGKLRFQIPQKRLARENKEKQS